MWSCLIAILLFWGPQESGATVEQLGQWAEDSWSARAEGHYQEAARLAEKVVAERDSTSMRIHLGSCYFMRGEMAKAVAAYDQALKLEPNVAPQLWQRGLALYYAKRFKEGQEQFETHQTYNTQDVENAVWHMLCRSQVDGLEKAREDLIPIERDSRIPMKQIHQLFAGSASVDEVIKAAESVSDAERRKESLYYAHLYIGLYQEMCGDHDESRKSMRAAMKVNPIPEQYLMGKVAEVQLQLRKAEAAAQADEETPPDSPATEADKK